MVTGPGCCGKASCLAVSASSNLCGRGSHPLATDAATRFGAVDPQPVAAGMVDVCRRAVRVADEGDPVAVAVHHRGQRTEAVRDWPGRELQHQSAVRLVQAHRVRRVVPHAGGRRAPSVGSTRWPGCVIVIPGSATTVRAVPRVRLGVSIHSGLPGVVGSRPDTGRRCLRVRPRRPAWSGLAVAAGRRGRGFWSSRTGASRPCDRSRFVVSRVAGGGSSLTVVALSRRSRRAGLPPDPPVSVLRRRHGASRPDQSRERRRLERCGARSAPCRSSSWTRRTSADPSAAQAARCWRSLRCAAS